MGTLVGSTMCFSMRSVVRSVNLPELESLTLEFSSAFVEGIQLWRSVPVTFGCILARCFSFTSSAGIPSAVPAGRSKSWAKAITSRAAVSASPKPTVKAETSVLPPTLELENVIVTRFLPSIDPANSSTIVLFYFFFSLFFQSNLHSTQLSNCIYVRTDVYEAYIYLVSSIYIKITYGAASLAWLVSALKRILVPTLSVAVPRQSCLASSARLSSLFRRAVNKVNDRLTRLNNFVNDSYTAYFIVKRNAVN